MSEEFQQPTADEALQRLIDGNDRFWRGEARLFGLQREKLAELSKGQRPYATILGCSDSRVAPEWIFDAGLGELFVIRVAGNVLSPEVAGSMQYAGAHLRTPLFVVLGHEGCGAVHAALLAREQGLSQLSRIQILVNSILPGLGESDRQLPLAQRLSQAIEANVRWTLTQIRSTPEAQKREAEGVVKLVGAVYDIESGRVKWLS